MCNFKPTKIAYKNVIKFHVVNSSEVMQTKKTKS